MMLSIIIIILVSYILGSLPYGLILVKIFKNQDIREIGSKNIGATNILRAGYPILAIFTLLLDALKGLIAVIIFKYIIIFDVANAGSLAGLFAMIGHIYPIWLKFKGGKGVASAFGIILALNPIMGILSIIVWLLSAIITKYSSLSAIITMIFLPFFTLWLEPDIFFYMLIMAVIILYKHKANFVRLYKKEETKITFKKKRI